MLEDCSGMFSQLVKVIVWSGVWLLLAMYYNSAQALLGTRRLIISLFEIARAHY